MIQFERSLTWFDICYQVVWSLFGMVCCGLDICLIWAIQIRFYHLGDHILFLSEGGTILITN